MKAVALFSSPPVPMPDPWRKPRQSNPEKPETPTTEGMFMDKEMVEHFEARLKTLDILIKVAVALLAGAFSLGVWVATHEWKIGALTQYAHDHGAVLSELTLWKAETSSNRFTVQDYSKGNSIIQEAQVTQDKRTTRLEDNMARVEKALDRIENKLGTKP